VDNRPRTARRQREMIKISCHRIHLLSEGTFWDTVYGSHKEKVKKQGVSNVASLLGVEGHTFYSRMVVWQASPCVGQDARFVDRRSTIQSLEVTARFVQSIPQYYGPCRVLQIQLQNLTRNFYHKTFGFQRTDSKRQLIDLLIG
jgi:hypothetical protein